MQPRHPPSPLPNAVPFMERAMEHHRAGRINEAAEQYAEALNIDPDYVQAHNNLSIALKALGRLDDAINHYQRAIAIQPGNASIHCNMGVTLTELGRLDDAIASHRRAIELDPAYADAYSNLGSAFHAQGLPEDAIAAYTKAIEINPGMVEAHTNLGNTLRDQGRYDDAIASYHDAITRKPEYAEAHNNLGIALRDQGRYDDAIASHRQALTINPDFAGAHADLGVALGKRGSLDKAEASYRKAAELDPGLIEALCNLGNVLSDQRKLDLSLAAYKQAMTIRPQAAGPANNYLHTLLYVPGLSNEKLFAAYREVIDDRHATPSLPTRSAMPGPGDNEKLRIGYLSSDFYGHPVGDVILPLLGNHDHDRFEIFCYADVAKPDTATQSFQKFADHWRPIHGLTDEDIAEKINADGIHIMIYLGGHFDNNHPAVASWRPAPVQVALHGGTTSALDAMDYWLTDDVLHPPSDQGGTTEQFTEDLYRLPAFYLFPATGGTPPVSTLPAKDNGVITFCSFNKPCKINDTVLDLWSEVLRAVPGSRLKLKFKNYWAIPAVHQPVLERFDANGIPPERITLISTEDNFHDHLGHYADADIALDPFPFNGATTTFQALWMGVPVISLLGDRFISRAGGSISTHAGLGDLVAGTPEAYIDNAVALAANLPRLEGLRASLRGRIEQSSICDAPGYAANVEKAFLDMWKAFQPS